MASLYSNENYPLGIVEELRKLGHDVMTAHEAGNAGRGVPDEEVLHFATEAGRAVITHNRRHFFRLHEATNGQHAGIIACTYDPDEARQARFVHDAIAEAGGQLAGMVLRVYRPNTA
jgi:hypothetical protein